MNKPESFHVEHVEHDDEYLVIERDDDGEDITIWEAFDSETDAIAAAKQMNEEFPNQ